MHFKQTEYGFEYGAAKVTRVCSDKENGWIVLLVKTPKHPHGIQLYVTKTGKVRIHSEDSEWLKQVKEG